MNLKRAAVYYEEPEATLRDRHFHSRPRVAANGQTIPGNGFERAFVKIGRSVRLVPDKYEEIIFSQQCYTSGGENE